MIQKNVCKECRKKFIGLHSHMVNLFDKWDKIYCPVNGRNSSSKYKILSMDSEPPDYCPYRLEHMVLVDEGVNS